MQKSMTHLRTNDKMVLESLMNRNMEMMTTAKSILSKPHDKPSTLDESWRKMFAELHRSSSTTKDD